MFKKSKQKKEHIITATMLNEMLDQKLNGDSVDFKGNSELEVFFRKIDDILVKDNTQKHATLKEINQLGQYIMKMDFVRDMIQRLNTQLNSIETVAAASEEMSASISDISERIEHNTEAASNSVDIANKGTEELNDAVSVINGAFDLTEDAKLKVGDVTLQAAKIRDMVSIIQSVSEQTNLLALNASIEAARAGDAGRGFAVVANEIKKLSESTQESVKLIEGAVSDLDISVNGSVKAMDEATSSFEKGVSFIGNASQAVETSKDEIHKILGNMEIINERIIQQSSVSYEVAENVSEINEQTRELHSKTQQTGKAFSDIALEVDQIRTELITATDDLSDGDIIDIAITDHLKWRWTIYNMILGYEKVELDTVSNHNQCRLGKWINKQDPNDTQFKRAFDKIHGPHEKLHVAAKNAVKAYNSGNEELANQCLKEIDEESEVIIATLSEIMASTLDKQTTTSTVALFEWSQKLTVYNDEIDGQHKVLLGLGKKLQNFRNKANKDKAEFLSIVTELKDYTVYHFECEEGIMERGNYPALDKHKIIHKNFVNEILKIDFNAFDYEDKEALKGLIVFLSKWVLQHIRNEDFKYTSYIGDQGKY